jgi:hypothetical protein
VLINLKTFYNQSFLKLTRHVIMKEADKFNEAAEFFDTNEAESNRLQILKKMNLDSPLHTSIPNLIPK